MATKYKFERLRAHIVQGLEREWPPTAAHWLRLDNAISEQDQNTSSVRRRLIDDTRNRSGGPAPWADFAAPSAPTFIRFARDHDIPSILPAAFYSLFCQDKPYSSEYIEVYRQGPYRKSPFLGGSRPLDMKKTHWKRTWDVSRMTQWPELTKQDIEVFVDMVHLVDNWVKRELVQHCNHCEERISNAKGDKDAERKGLSLIEVFRATAHSAEMDPLYLLRELQRRRYSSSSLHRSLRWSNKCRACAKRVEKDEEAAFHDLWDSFRALFGLPSLRTPVRGLLLPDAFASSYLLIEPGALQFKFPRYEGSEDSEDDTSDDSSNANQIDDGDD